MFRLGTPAPLPFLAIAIALVTACAPASHPEVAQDAEFAALQARGEVGMGVDQYASTHVFDALPDGGRIEFQHDDDDAEAVARIRRHLQEIQVAFEAGDFSTPAFVHDREVPGTDVMAARKEHIEYRYRDLPRGGELRLITNDPEALRAIREFMAFQRDDHRAGGMERGAMDHGAMDHGAMDHRGMDHGALHGAMGMGPGAMEPGAMDRTRGPMAMGGGDSAFAADMAIVHELLTNHRAITRTVVHLPNGIRTLTESSSPAIAGLIVSHVASMERRLEDGEVFNVFSHTIPTLFDGYSRIRSEFGYTPTGVAVVQISDDPAIVEALQAHAAEVTELVDEGMIAMMRGMMERRMQGGMPEGMRGRMMGGMHERRGMHGEGGMHERPSR
jgi:hypothetical protein